MRKCKDGLQCIDVRHMCDGQHDCKDESDESMPLEMCLSIMHKFRVLFSF